MNRIIKKMTVVFLSLAITLLAFPAGILTAYAGAGKITFSDPTASVGNQVSVTMKIASSDGTALNKADVMLEYDAQSLEFLSGTSANGGAGNVRVVGDAEAASQTTFSFTLKFKALKAGTSSITVKSQEVYDANGQAVTISHTGNSAVKVSGGSDASQDASLGSLTVSPGTLSPEFSAEVTEYTAAVPADVEKITVSAPANDGKANVSVEGAEDLQPGENKVVCTVTAEDGSTKKTYTITVTRGGDSSAEETEPSAEASSPEGTPHNVEDGNWTVAETFDAETLPEGFSVTEYEYQGATVQAGTNDQGVILLYMTDEDGNGDFFVYDPQEDILSPYVTVRMAEKTIIVLSPENIPEGTELPDGFRECTIDIGEHTVHGWIWNSQDGGTPEYCIVYGQNADGEQNFYRYDQKEMTLQRFFQDPEAEELRAGNEKVVGEYNSLVEDYTVRGYMIAGLFAVCIILAIILIILLLTRKPGGTYREEKPKKSAGKPDAYSREGSRPGKTKEPRRTQAKKWTDQDLDDLEDLDLEEEERAFVKHKAPVRHPASDQGTGRRTASVPEAEAPVRQETPAPVSSAPVKEQIPEKAAPFKEEDQDDDFEFIDLDL